MVMMAGLAHKNGKFWPEFLKIQDSDQLSMLYSYLIPI